MHRLILTILILAVSTTAFGANVSLKSDRIEITPDKAISVDPDLNKNATNAHWQVVSGEAACVVDGGSEYYTDDDTWMYSGPYDLSGYESTDLEFYYSLAVADSNDVFSVYVTDTEPTDSSALTSPLATYNSDESGATINLDPGIDDHTYIVFRWESDGSGVDDGVRVDDIVLIGEGLSAGDEVASGTSDQSPPYNRNYDMSTWADGEEIIVGFHYDDETYSGNWGWNIDEVEVNDDAKAQLYYEDFEGGDPAWNQTQHSGSGSWDYINTSGSYMGEGMNGYFYYAGDENVEADYDVECFTPMIDCTSSSGVELDFLGNFEDYAGNGDWYINVYTLDSTEEFNEDCSDLGDWDTVDEGTGVGIESASMGTIKALFK